MTTVLHHTATTVQEVVAAGDALGPLCSIALLLLLATACKLLNHLSRYHIMHRRANASAHSIASENLVLLAAAAAAAAVGCCYGLGLMTSSAC
eukprot:6699-Heterococcus_DN1.PRE.1